MAIGVSRRAFILSLGLIASRSPVLLWGQQPTVEHKHATHGPHHGELLEIGKHEFHAELVLIEDKKQIDIYLLDRELKSNVAIGSPQLSVNVTYKGKPTQFPLKAIPQESDQRGLSSRFGTTSSELLDALHGAKSDARMNVRIGSKNYVVKIVHTHDHSGHSHAGHSHVGQSASDKVGNQNANRTPILIPKKR